MANDSRPILGITMGDLSGVGPEIIAGALNDPAGLKICRPLVIGDPAAMDKAIALKESNLKVELLEPGSDPSGLPGTIELLALSDFSQSDLVLGKPSAAVGRAAGTYIEKGAALALEGRIQALVTAPINKQALALGGYDFPGHTEMLAHLSGADDVVMMLAGPKLRVALVTTHHALRDVPDLITEAGVGKTISITAGSLKKYFGLESPCLAVAALNPHASDGGLFGVEEKEIIEPAIKKALSDGIDVSGPFPADSLFYRAARGDYDAVICMYHDQALIPLKMLHFEDGVNITLGLPFIRTSVDHGTAYDIAWQGRADHTSLSAAIAMAVSMAVTKNAGFPK